ncbi:MAG: SufE family protein [Rhodospirillales bacterium]|nr:SufE family protein [Rhodospirillales bacterium]
MGTRTAYETHVSALDVIDDDDARLRSIIELGRRRQSEPFPAAWKTDANLLHGCMAKVWIVHAVEGDRHVFHGRSDALVVNGIAAIMTESFSGLTRAELLSRTLDDVRRFRLGALATERQLGMMAMLKRFQKLAATSQPEN